MPKEIQLAVDGLVTDILEVSMLPTSDWLVRPGRSE